MALTDKYKSVLEFAQANGVQMDNFHEENGALTFNGTAPTPFVKNAIFDLFKSTNGMDKDGQVTDVNANINVADSSVYHRHTVEKGETLGAIAKHYLGAAGKYMAIFEANKGTLSDPDHISVGQELIIPNVD